MTKRLSLIVLLAALTVLVLSSTSSAAGSSNWKTCGSVRDGVGRLSAEAMKAPCATALKIARAFTGNFTRHCGLDANYHEICHLAGFDCPMYGRRPDSGVICTKEEARVRIKGVHSNDARRSRSATS
jgi:hypothetical protein